MKIKPNTLLMGMAAAFCCSIGSAQTTTIYSQTFDGGAVNINGVAPTYIDPNAATFGGNSGATWDVVRDQGPSASTPDNYYAYQNGTLGSRQETVLLPFAPVSGYTYTLSASLTLTAIPPGGGWGALGFAANLPASSSSTGDPRFNQAIITGQPWASVNYASQGNGSVLYRVTTTTVGSMGGLISELNTPYTINLILDTTAADWSTALYVDDTLVASYTWTSGNPTISSFGYGQTATTAGAYQWNALSLTAAPVPEPSVLALAGLGLAGLCGIRRLRK